MDSDRTDGSLAVHKEHEDTVDSDQDDQDDHAEENGAAEMTTHNPVDRGWAWVIVMCVFVIQFVCVGLVRAFGVIFVAIQLKFESSATMIAVLGGVESAVFSITALVCMSGVLQVLSVRRTIVLGTVLAVAGFVACFLATDVVQVVLFFSLFIGVAMGLTIGPGFALINAYFKHKLPFATAIANTGASIGSIVMPITTRMLLDHYFLSGAFLLLGGIFAQTFVFGALLTPVEDYKPSKPSHPEHSLPTEKRRRTIQRHRLIAKKTRMDSQRAMSESAMLDVRQNQTLDASTGVKHHTKSLQAINDDRADHHARSCPRTEQQGCRNGFVMVAGTGGSHAISISSLNLCTNLLLTESGLLQEIQHGKVQKIECLENNSYHKQDSHKESRSCCTTMAKTLSGMFDPALFRSVIFWLTAFYHYLGGLMCGLPAAYIPALAQEKGLTTTQGALLLTISGGLDILSRLVPGILAQSRLVRPRTSVLVSLVVLGTLFQFTALAQDMVALTLMSVVYGLFAGVFFSMLPLIILEFNDSSQFCKMFGFTQLALGIGGTTGFPIIGYLKDSSGSYVTSFHFMGGCGLVASVLLLLMPFLHKRQARVLDSVPDPERPSQKKR